MINDEIKT